MRVSFAQSYDNSSVGISQKREDIDQLSTIVGSGQKVNNQQDDPSGWAQSVNYTQAIRQIAACENNIVFASGWNQVAEQALSAIGGGPQNGQDDFLTQASKIADQAKTADSQTRTSLATTVDNIVRQVVDLANSKYDDSYVFSGRKVSTRPFEITESAGGISSVTYNGDGQDLQVRVGSNSQQTVNLDGQTTFKNPDPTKNVIDSLVDLAQQIRAGNDTAIEAARSNVDSSRQYLMTQISTLGFQQSDLDQKKDILNSLKVQNENQVTSIKEADMAQTIVQLQQKQTMYEAALSAAATVARLNLTQFL